MFQNVSTCSRHMRANDKHSRHMVVSLEPLSTGNRAEGRFLTICHGGLGWYWGGFSLSSSGFWLGEGVVNPRHLPKPGYFSRESSGGSWTTMQWYSSLSFLWGTLELSGACSGVTEPHSTLFGIATDSKSTLFKVLMMKEARSNPICRREKMTWWPWRSIIYIP